MEFTLGAGAIKSVAEHQPCWGKLERLCPGSDVLVLFAEQVGRWEEERRALKADSGVPTACPTEGQWRPAVVVQWSALRVSGAGTVKVPAMKNGRF